MDLLAKECYNNITLEKGYEKNNINYDKFKTEFDILYNLNKLPYLYNLVDMISFPISNERKKKNYELIRDIELNKIDGLFIWVSYLYYKKYFKLPEVYKNTTTPWLAFPLVIKKNKKFSRKEMQIFFEKNNIQTRTIFTGNILKQPLMKKLNYKMHKDSNQIADDVMRNGILLGCHQGLKTADLKYISDVFKKFVRYKKLF